MYGFVGVLSVVYVFTHTHTHTHTHGELNVKVLVMLVNEQVEVFGTSINWVMGTFILMHVFIWLVL